MERHMTLELSTFLNDYLQFSQKLEIKKFYHTWYLLKIWNKCSLSSYKYYKKKKKKGIW